MRIKKSRQKKKVLKKPEPANWQTSVNPFINSAIAALKKNDFVAYLNCLNDFGELLEKIYKKHASEDLKPNRSKQVAKLAKINWFQTHLRKSSSYKLSNSGCLAYCVFEEAWIDDYLRKPITVNNQQAYKRFLSPKGNLNQSTRHHINLGMRFFAMCIERKNLPLRDENINIDTYKKIKKLDTKACAAIKAYRTKRQKILDTNGKIIAVVMTIVCSVMTAGAVAITVAAWPITVAAAITAIVFAACLVINWFSYRRVIPRMLNDLLGKDKFCEGWTTYRDPETGEKKKLSLGRKIALGISCAIASLLGAATGAVTYGFIMNLGKLAILPFLAAGTVGASCLPYLGIFFSTFFCLSSIVLMLRPIVNALKAKNLKAIFLQPFKQTATIFNPHNKRNIKKSLRRIKAEKIITYTILGGFSAFTLLGLIILQIQNGAALCNFLNKTLAISSAIAVGVSYTVSLISALLGQLPYALNTVASGLVAVIASYQNIISPRKEQNRNKIEKKPLPSRVKNQVVAGIKDTLNTLSPHKSIEKKSKKQRLRCIKTLFNPEETRPSSIKSSPSYSDSKQANIRARFYKLYFFSTSSHTSYHQSSTELTDQLKKSVRFS